VQRTMEQVRSLVAGEHGLAVVATARADGRIQSSVVNVGVLDHPGTGAPVLAFVARGGTRKLTNLRRARHATLTLRVGWGWITVEGTVELLGPADPFDPAVDLRSLLRDVFHAAGGQHDDLATYDAVMAQEGRTVVLVHPERIYGNDVDHEHVG